MSETLGGSITQTILGTRSTAFMTKLTAVCAVIFLFTSLFLTYFSAQKRVSLFRHYRAPKTTPIPESKSSPTPSAPETTSQAPTEASEIPAQPQGSVSGEASPTTATQTAPTEPSSAPISSTGEDQAGSTTP